MKTNEAKTLILYSIFCSYQDPNTKEVYPSLRYVFFSEAERAKDHALKLEQGCYVNFNLEEEDTKSLYAKVDHSYRYVRYNTDGAIYVGEKHDSHTLSGMAKSYYTIPELHAQAQPAFDVAKRALSEAADRFWENNWN
jgi:hypothetical protein